MTPVISNQYLHDRVLHILGEIAPEADLSKLDPKRSFRDQLDIDSVDLLNFLIAVDKELHVDIPEADYGKLVTLEGFVAYLAERLETP